MERKEAIIILKRIKNNYNEFVFDDYAIGEWYSELKDYSLEDVMQKLEQHFRSEQYGSSIPKVYFLTKYLTKEKDKDKKKKYKLKCPLCDEILNNEIYDKHFRRCSAIDNICRKIKKYNIKTEATREKMLLLDDFKFDRFYEKILSIAYSECDDEKEKDILSHILNYQESSNILE